MTLETISLFWPSAYCLRHHRAHAQSGAPTGTTTVSVTIGPQAGLTITNSSTPSDGEWLELQPILRHYRSDLLCAHHHDRRRRQHHLESYHRLQSDRRPVSGSPLAPGDALTYTCTVASPGTACTGTKPLPPAARRTWLPLERMFIPATWGSTASVGWSLANDPNYKTGTYSATVTFTISAS